MFRCVWLRHHELMNMRTGARPRVSAGAGLAEASIPRPLGRILLTVPDPDLGANAHTGAAGASW